MDDITLNSLIELIHIDTVEADSRYTDNTNRITHAIVEYLGKNDLSEKLATAINNYIEQLITNIDDSYSQVFAKRINAALLRKNGYHFFENDYWGYEINCWSEEHHDDLDMIRRINEVLSDCPANKPTKKWLTSVQGLIDDYSEALIIDTVRIWIDLFLDSKMSARIGINRCNANKLKAIVLLLSINKKNIDSTLFSQLVVLAFKKIPDFGPLAGSVGTVSIKALASMDGEQGVIELNVLAQRIKYPANAVTLVKKTLNEIAQKKNITSADLSDMVVNDYGLTVSDTQISEQLGGYTAVIQISAPGNVELLWKDGEGKARNRKPADIVKRCPDEFKAINNKFKSIRLSLQSQTSRIESFYLSDRGIEYRHWHQHFIDHPFMQFIARSLIWLIEDKTITTAIWNGQRLVNSNGVAITEPNESAIVRLWHPLHSDKKECLEWQHYIWQNAISQPFKQAYRESYRKDSGESFTELFDGIFVRQHQFKSLLTNREWQYQLQGGFDCDSVAEKKLDNGLSAYLYTGKNSNLVTTKGFWLAVELSGLEFVSASESESNNQVSLLLYSEVMRDIDLFTSVAGVGYSEDMKQIESVFNEIEDSMMSDYFASLSGPGASKLEKLLEKNKTMTKTITRLLCRLELSIENHPISESTKVRSVLLNTLLQCSDLASNARIDGRYVFVDNGENHYRINMASGLIFDCHDNSLINIKIKKLPGLMDGECLNDSLLPTIYGAISQLAKTR